MREHRNRPIRFRERRVRVIHTTDAPPCWPAFCVGLVFGLALAGVIFLLMS